jgi:hypothetical protein
MVREHVRHPTGRCRARSKAALDAVVLVGFCGRPWMSRGAGTVLTSERELWHAFNCKEGCMFDWATHAGYGPLAAGGNTMAVLW